MYRDSFLKNISKMKTENVKYEENKCKINDKKESICQELKIF